jgi:hypothetical protein
MVYFQTKNPDLCKFSRVLQWKILAYFMAVKSTLRPFGIFVAVCYILWSFGIFFLFWYIAPRKIWQPCYRHERLLPRTRLSVLQHRPHPARFRIFVDCFAFRRSHVVASFEDRLFGQARKTPLRGLRNAVLGDFFSSSAHSGKEN